MDQNWNHLYIVIRINETGTAEVVHTCSTMKDANYWLTYIALPGDAIFNTPLHPKNTGPTPVYYAHLVSRGKTEHDEKKWKENFLKSIPNLVMPTPC